ncbi:hypothetical protein [Moorena producens]|uniref:hypothetical protein n=1 Tax=Moorena producens TaxID=1155739 RepID=UPI003C758E08
MGLIFDKGCSPVLGRSRHLNLLMVLEITVNQCGLGGLAQDRISVVYSICDGIAILSSLWQDPLWRDPLFPKIQDCVPHRIENRYI